MRHSPSTASQPNTQQRVSTHLPHPYTPSAPSGVLVALAYGFCFGSLGKKKA